MLDKLKPALDLLAAVPDDLWALGVVVVGAGLTVAKQHDSGASLIAAGLAMWKGKR